MANESSELPLDLLNSLLQMVQALDQFGVRYALVGGVAAGYRSRPRFTQDVDFLLDVPQLVLPGLLGDLQARGFAFEMESVIREWTREHMSSLSYRGVQIDWLKPVLPCYRLVIDHARPEVWLGQSVRIASPEGLILMKLLAFRGQDQVDIENLLAANRGQLDLDLIRREWQTLAPAEDPRWLRFEEMVARLHVPRHQTDP